MLQGCWVTREAYEKVLSDNKLKQEQIARLKMDVATLKTNNQNYLEQIEQLQRSIFDKDRLNLEKEEQIREKARRVQELETAIAEKDQEITSLRRRIAEVPEPTKGPDKSSVEERDGYEIHRGEHGDMIRLKDVTFSSGQANLSPRGLAALQEIVPELKAKIEQGYRIRIEGHTDNVPVRRTLQLYPHGNIQLSGMRALMTLVALKQLGIPEKTTHYAGFGEWNPIADNGSPAGQSKNRRVEIFVYK